MIWLMVNLPTGQEMRNHSIRYDNWLKLEWMDSFVSTVDNSLVYLNFSYGTNSTVNESKATLQSGTFSVNSIGRNVQKIWAQQIIIPLNKQLGMVAVIKVQNMFCDHTNDAHRSSKQRDRISVCTWISEALKKHIQPFHASSNASLICLEHLGSL